MAEADGPARKNSNGSTTMETLISFGLKELSRSGSIDFSLETVLRESGVSRGSLYHHFGSRHGLICHCEAQQLKQTLKSENEIIRTLIETGTSGDELFELLAIFIRTLGSEKVVEQRSRRLRTLATSAEDPALRTMLAESQIKGSQFLIESFQIAIDKGFIKPLVPLDAMVYLIQSMFLGRALVDITNNAALSESVNEATIEALRHIMNPQK